MVICSLLHAHKPHHPGSGVTTTQANPNHPPQQALPAPEQDALQPPDQQALLDDLFNGCHDLGALAHRHGMALEDLAKWANQPGNLKTLTSLADLADMQTQVLISRARISAVARLIELSNQDDSPELARKASVDLLKIDLRGKGNCKPKRQHQRAHKSSRNTISHISKFSPCACTRENSTKPQDAQDLSARTEVVNLSKITPPTNLPLTNFNVCVTSSPHTGLFPCWPTRMGDNANMMFPAHFYRTRQCVSPAATRVLLLAVLLAMIAPASVRAEEQEKPLSQEMSELLQKISNPRMRGEAAERLREIGSDGAPYLIDVLQNGTDFNKMRAIVCLQYCWTRDATQALVATAENRNPKVRDLAFGLLRQKLDQDDLFFVLQPLVDSKDERVAAEAASYLLASKPDAKWMKLILKHRDVWPRAAPQLPRFQAADFIEQIRLMMRHQDSDVTRFAIVAATHQLADDLATRNVVLSLLRHPDPKVRDVAYEYFRWHGTEREQARVTQLSRVERDEFARASAVAAAEAIERRENWLKDMKENAGATEEEAAVNQPDTGRAQENDEEGLLAASLDELLKQMQKSPTVELRTNAIEALRKSNRIQEFYRYAKRDQENTSREPLANRLKLLTLVTGYSLDGVHSFANVNQTREEMPDALPKAEKLMAPVRDYFDEKRQSFGLQIDANHGPFSGKVHVGDDMAWREQQATVVAIGDGRVRFAVVAASSWGGLVIIEHETPGGKHFCSLYGHLGPLIPVREGQVVKKGQKIGSLGRDLTEENGGYVTHLHFGLHEGAYDRGQWITGYLKPEQYRDAKSGWVDPQDFIETYEYRIRHEDEDE